MLTILLVLLPVSPSLVLTILLPVSPSPMLAVLLVLLPVSPSPLCPFDDCLLRGDGCEWLSLVRSAAAVALRAWAAALLPPAGDNTGSFL